MRRCSKRSGEYLIFDSDQDGGAVMGISADGRFSRFRYAFGRGRTEENT
jgi:hypothetical protein